MFKLLISILLIVYSTRSNGLPATSLSQKLEAYNDYDQNSNELSSIKSFTSNEDEDINEDVDVNHSDENKFFLELIEKLKATKLFELDQLYNNDNLLSHKDDGLLNNHNLKDELNSFKEIKPDDIIGYDGEAKQPIAES